MLNRPKVMRRDLAWGPHGVINSFGYWSSYARSLETDTGTLDFGTIYRGTATKAWFLFAGNGSTNGNLKGVEVRDATTNAVLSTVTANTILGTNTGEANRWYGIPLTAATENQEIYLRFFDNDANSFAAWFGVALQTYFLEI